MRHDFFIGEIAPGFVDCAAIESPGLSSAPAIGAMVADIVRGSLHLHNKPDFDPTRRAFWTPKRWILQRGRSLSGKTRPTGRLYAGARA